MTSIAVRGFIYDKKQLKKFEPLQSVKFTKILVFDTETTNDVYQNLKFGSYLAVDDNAVESMGMFYHPSLAENEKKILDRFCNEKHIDLMTLKEFVNNVFYPKVYHEEYLCIGFNLPFDISRLAMSYSYARRFMKDGFSFKLTENKNLPRIRIKHNKNKISFINFSSGLDRKKKPSKFRGNFLDLSNLVFALTNDSLSLEKACERFDTNPKKTKTKEHGKITPEYLEYNLTDTLATYSLYKRASEEYEKYNINQHITKIYSPASIGKACLNKFGIRSFMEQNPTFSPTKLGYIMSSYYGGRCEVKIRKQPTRIVLLDFLSMYPTVCILQNLWKFITAEKIEAFEDTENVKKLLDNITIEDIQKPYTWKRLQAIVKIIPDNDILPLRTKYNGKNTYNIGVNYVTSQRPMYYTLADVIASKFLFGKTPKILKAYSFVPKGMQKLTKTVISGMKIDPTKEDFFQRLIEERKKIQTELESLSKSDPSYKVLDSKQNVFKIIANATSYGIFIEINHDYKAGKVNVYSLEKLLGITRDKPEKLGDYYNPIIATFITSASRLILATVEKLLENNGTSHAFCDTDSMAVPYDQYENINKFFNSLNPYVFKSDLFKLEKENYKNKDKKKGMVELWFYGISAKRYVLYYFDKEEIVIQKASLHGLGHLRNPFGSEVEKWQSRIWMDILKEHYGIMNSEELDHIYSNCYGLAKLAISTRNLMERFSDFNKVKSYSKQTKPFNFMVVGIGNKSDKKKCKIKPIAPFSNDIQSVVHSKFIDYNSGKTLQGLEYWKPLDSVIFHYKNNAEAKLEGNEGSLKRKTIVVDDIITIGKEATNISMEFLDEPEYDIYISSKQFKEKVLHLTPKQAKKFGISRHALWYVKKRFLSGKFRLSQKMKTRLLKAIEV